MSDAPPSKPYQPTSRRPIAALFRKTAHWCVNLCVTWGVHPDTISYGSLVVSAVAALCFLFAMRWPWLFLIGPLFCFLRLWFNMLDGMVALAAGLASRRGEILNELPDRFSDVLVFVAIAESGACRPSLGYWAAIGALLTAYVGTLSQAVGAHRQYGGLMSKPWRMVVLAAGAWGTFALFMMDKSFPYVSISLPLNSACTVVIAGCVQTVWVRLRRTLQAIGTQ